MLYSDYNNCISLIMYILYSSIIYVYIVCICVYNINIFQKKIVKLFVCFYDTVTI